MRTSISALGIEVLTLVIPARRAARERRCYRDVVTVEPVDHRQDGAACAIGCIRGIFGALP